MIIRYKLWKKEFALRYPIIRIAWEAITNNPMISQKELGNVLGYSDRMAEVYILFLINCGYIKKLPGMHGYEIVIPLVAGRRIVA